VNDKGEATHEWEFVDFATMLGQLNPMKEHPVRAAMDKLPMPKEVVISKGDDKEKANLAAFDKGLEAWNKHDAKAFGDILTDDALWSSQDQPKDLTKKADVVAFHVGFWKAFSDMKITPSTKIAAGDYVAFVGNLEGTNDGAMPAMGIKAKTGKHVQGAFLAILKFDGGKLKATWVFQQGMALPMQLGLMPAPGAPPAAGSGATPPKK
jgi:predicted ester cyclase